MKRIFISIAFITLYCIIPICGQKKKPNTPNAKIKTENATKMSEQKIAQMIAATQQIVFIDSIVVDKNTFLDKYALTPDAGKLYKYNDFFSSNTHPEAFLYVNGLGDKCYFSVADSSSLFTLYTCDKYDETWTSPSRLAGLHDNKGLKSLNYPFMMADGTTLYFAATGDESIGGYDIFVTRFDTEAGKFLKPENIGMPFNSAANDYMYAIDEFCKVGWFATDRNQKEGKACIYKFVPSDTRQTYSPTLYSEKQIQSFANLESIADTWGDGTERRMALDRMKNMLEGRLKENDSSSFAFIINDKTTYTDISDFRSNANREKYNMLLSLNGKKEMLCKTLDKNRESYAVANAQDKLSLTSKIRENEQLLETLEIQTRQLEKEIRNTENNLLK